MVTTITTDLDPVPSRQRPVSFSSEMDTFLGKLVAWTTEANAVSTEVNNNAITAEAGAAAVNAEKWVSGTTYDEGDVVWSPADFKVYRRKSTGAGTTDPSLDETNWAAFAGLGDVIVDAEQTLTNKTISAADNTLTGVVTLTGEQTLTNKTITLTANTISGTIAEFNTAVTDGDFASLTGTQELTNKTINAASNTLTGVATLTGTQELTNKTINAASNTLTGVVTLTGTQELTNKTITSPTITSPTLTGITEEVSALSGATPEIEAGISTWTLSAASTPTDGLSAGQSAVLMIDDGSANTITWPSVTWKTDYGTAPTLETTGYTVVTLWKVGTTLYGARVGNA